MKPFILLFMLALCLNAAARVKTFVPEKALVKKLAPKGVVKAAIGWTDNAGKHILVATETGSFDGREEGSQSAELFVAQYLIADSPRLEWKLTDHERDCQVDILVSFVSHSFSITDIDGDGETEAWFAYRTACRGDVSPSALKLMMFEGKRKHGYRGQSRVRVGEKEYAGGEGRPDKALLTAPEVFLKKAEALWKKYRNESFN